MNHRSNRAWLPKAYLALLIAISTPPFQVTADAELLNTVLLV